MLVGHVFADVVGFLHLYDLDALLLTNARCSTLAQSAVAKIRVFDFPDHRFTFLPAALRVDDMTIRVPIGRNTGLPDPSLTMLGFTDATQLVDFIRDALRNCNLASMQITGGGTDFARMYEVTRAIAAVAPTITIGGRGLFINVRAFSTLQDIAAFIGSFRSVKV